MARPEERTRASWMNRNGGEVVASNIQYPLCTIPSRNSFSSVETLLEAVIRLKNIIINFHRTSNQFYEITCFLGYALPAHEVSKIAAPKKRRIRRDEQKNFKTLQN